MAIKNVTLIGAGGNLGPSVLTQLLAAKEFNVTVLSRANSSATFPDGVPVKKADLDSVESLTAALKGQDAVVSTVGSAGLKAQETLVDACVAAGVQKLIPSEFGSDTTNKKAITEMGPLFEEKETVLEYTKKAVAEHKSLTYTGICTGPFFDWGLKAGLTGIDLANKKVTLYDNGDIPISYTTLSDVGRGVVGVLRHPDETANKIIFIASLTASQVDLVAAVEKASGDKFAVEHASSVESRKQGKELMEKGELFPGIFARLKGVIYGGPDFTNDFAKYHSISNDLLGVPHRDVNATVAAVLKGEQV